MTHKSSFTPGTTCQPHSQLPGKFGTGHMYTAKCLSLLISSGMYFLQNAATCINCWTPFINSFNLGFRNFAPLSLHVHQRLQTKRSHSLATFLAVTISVPSVRCSQLFSEPRDSQMRILKIGHGCRKCCNKERWHCKERRQIHLHAGSPSLHSTAAPKVPPPPRQKRSSIMHKQPPLLNSNYVCSMFHSLPLPEHDLALT